MDARAEALNRGTYVQSTTWLEKLRSNLPELRARRMLKVDQVHVVRHKVLVEGRSQRRIAKEFGISRVTVRKYVEQAVPGRTEAAPRPRPVWDAVGPRLDALLTESARWTGAKQRLTATRLHELLVAE